MLESGYHPPDGIWRFRPREPVNPLNTGHFLVAVDIGKLPKTVTNAQVEALLERTTRPLSDKVPEQNCVTWTRDAIVDLQRAGFFDGSLGVEAIMEVAMQKADGIMKARRPPSVKDRFTDIDVIRREVAALNKKK
jgi:hypothetical protein